MTKPPFTPNTCPVMNSCSARHKTAWATSSWVPVRCRGVSSFRAARSAGDSPAFIGVSMTPGATQFTRMPEGPSSWASAWVRPMSAAFEAE